MGIQEKIKDNVLQELNGLIDEAYDLMHRRFLLEKEEDALLIKKLNEAKEVIHTVAKKSSLS